MKTHWNTLEKSRRQLPSSPQDRVGPQGRLAAFCSAICRLMGRLVNMGIYRNRLLFTFTVSPVDASCESTKEKKENGTRGNLHYTSMTWSSLLLSLSFAFVFEGRKTKRGSSQTSAKARTGKDQGQGRGAPPGLPCLCHHCLPGSASAGSRSRAQPGTLIQASGILTGVLTARLHACP